MIQYLGTQGRLLHWYPHGVANNKALSAAHPELLVRFAKESSMKKAEMFPDLDHMDVTSRMETIANIRGDPILFQIPLVPCYGLTIHKTQACLGVAKNIVADRFRNPYTFSVE